ncbi:MULTISPECIES: MFS transporter [unclassified Hyphomicrobium]|uniref:MFS transporter n=1 Tax=unclassified Hyphomicrobium TaxID=2619925 RepID=UPI000213F701|nr:MULTISPECIES: MFS transporter [unclassified Hyphomicrobium]CCB66813.1 putative tartrate transporter [Hyphomicrobium sp. MC1]
MSDALSCALSKVQYRILPLLIAGYFAAYLDRVNVSFAALQMNADLSIGPEAFGFVSGVFFLGYFLFEVPSNIVLTRVGARLWLSRIMITWGILSAGTAFVSNSTELAVLRFLLGSAEAGFFPGVIYYLTNWVPSAERARIVSVFMMAIPISTIIGAPISGWILDAWNGVLGLRGWQWQFILEAFPAIALGVVCLLRLPETPADAKWLTPAERDDLLAQLASDRQENVPSHSHSIRDALTDKRVIVLAISCFGAGIGLYGLGFWMPQIVKSMSLSNTETGFVVAVPYAISAIFMVVWGRHSDRTGERIWHIAVPCFVASVAFALSAFVTAPIVVLVLLTVASACTLAIFPVFWTVPAALLAGPAAAAGIALINAVANSSGFFGPYLIGFAKANGASSQTAVALLSFFMFAGGILILAMDFGSEKRRETDQRHFSSEAR